MLSRILVPIMAVALLFMFACEDDSVSSKILDQSVTVSLNGGASVTYDNPLTILASYLPTGDGIVGDSSFYLIATEGSTSSIFITFKGNTAGTYNVSFAEGFADGSNNFNISYAKSETEIYAISISGSVTVTAFGAVGELVAGTYDAMLSVFADGEPTTETARVSGSFSVERKADGTSAQ